ncbi:hypothetical protein D0Z07_1583 [Hyphodiscus hymeniophilus]|uniref:GAT domain-containing protein n=1 Tax=Hyphodiscus hymeniophilus TaxID=353542 RepID=A0A9P7AZQ8_9HELO|nr:hypothetical protein D0Z07_1583 [Hyphodiscus hymeniophilus]
MKAMKSMNMNRMLGSLKRKPARDSNPVDGGGVADSQLDTPEANAARSVRLFCESGGPQGSGEEVLFLPTIVESAESSPNAAKECAVVIRKFLSKENFSKPYIQYNAIMLIRILSDNPGKTFTRNVDVKFVEAVKELLRVGRDPSVKQILMETLDTFSREKAEDEGLLKLNEMWKKEHERMVKIHGPTGPRTLNAPHFDNQNYFARNHHTKRLPDPQELASRIEEARTSAKLLSQLTQSTPPSEVMSSDLIKEFADRCQSASRSIQAYMISENPSPDNDTMETLIETNEQLGKAMNQHQRAVLNARKAAGLGTGTPTPPPARDSAYVPPSRTESGFSPPPGPPPSQVNKQPIPIIAPTPVRITTASKKAPQIPPPGDYAPNLSDDEEAVNPFNDPQAASTGSSGARAPFSEDRAPVATGQFNDRLGIEPYHPGFKETQSYVGRQDSSLGKLTMHAAGDDVEEEDEDEDDRGYGAKAGAKAPVYRY